MSSIPKSIDEEPQMQQLRVLVVDDYPDSARAMSLLIHARFGCQVRTCTDARRVEPTALDYQPHIIFLDLGMPGVSGFELADTLRQYPAFKHTVLVAVTGYSGQETIDRVAQSGFGFYLLKPADYDEIGRILARRYSMLTPD